MTKDDNKKSFNRVCSQLLNVYLTPLMYIIVWYVSIGILLIAQYDTDTAIDVWAMTMDYLLTAYNVFLLISIFAYSLYVIYLISKKKREVVKK